MKEPWSKKHKKDFKSCKFSLSNSFADPLSHPELVRLTEDRNDTALLEEYHSHDLTYTPNGGSDDLKQAIADLYGPSISKEHVLVFPGGQVAIQVAAQAFARDVRSITFVPGYQSTIESPEWAPNSKGVTKLQRRPENNWQIDIEDVRTAITDSPDTKYMVINEPYNPGGVVMSRDTQIALVELCNTHGITILSDEVYRLLEHDPSNDRIPAMAEAYPGGGISCVSMSKPWGACGITVGWLVCSDLSKIHALWDRQYFGTACVGRACELQAIMVLRASERILENRRSIILANKALLQGVIEDRYPEFFEWIRPNAGAIAFVRFKGPLTSLELGRLLQERGISIKPAYCFSGDNVTPAVDCFRVGFGERKMPSALDAFVAVVVEFEEAWREEMKQRK
jgi:aspartate/methionine/tyrosine aminotransferase